MNWVHKLSTSVQAIMSKSLVLSLFAQMHGLKNLVIKRMI